MLEHFCLFFSPQLISSHCIKIISWIPMQTPAVWGSGTAHRLPVIILPALPLTAAEQLHSFILNDILTFQSVSSDVPCARLLPHGQVLSATLMHNAWGCALPGWSGLLMDQYICCAQTVFLTALAPQVTHTPLLPEPFSHVSSWLSSGAGWAQGRMCWFRNILCTSAAGCGGAYVPKPCLTQGFKVA